MHYLLPRTGFDGWGAAGTDLITLIRKKKKSSPKSRWGKNRAGAGHRGRSVARSTPPERLMGRGGGKENSHARRYGKEQGKGARSIHHGKEPRCW